jgi:chromosome segregation ATPase
MLRAEHTSAKASEASPKDLAELEDLRARVAACRSEAESLRTRINQADEALAATKSAHATAAERLTDLEAQVRASAEREHRLEELRMEAPDPEEVYQRLFDLETQYQAATMAAARVPALEAQLAELEARLAKPTS